MYDITQPVPLLALPDQAYYQLIHTLAGILPPPVADTLEALLARNQAAIDKVAAMMPTNADEADLAAQCVAMRAQAEDVLRLIRQHEGDTKLVMKLNAQCNSMVRTSLAARRELRQVQAVRYKREANSASLKADESTQYISTRLMQQALEAGPVPVAATRQAAPAAAAQRALVPQPAPVVQPPVGAPEAGPVPAPAAALTPPPEFAPSVAAPVAGGEGAPAATPPLPSRTVPPPASAPVAADLLAQAAVEQAPAPRRPRRMEAPAEDDDPPRDLAGEADRYALVYPRRAWEIRRYGGLPPNCSFGPPDEVLVPAIAKGTSPTLRALDGMMAAAD